MKQQDIHQMKARAEEASHFLKQLASPVRLMVLCHLFMGERCVSDLEDSIGISQSAMSQHLAKLRADGMVEARREGLQVYYSVKDERVAKVLELLYGMFCAD